MRTITFLLLTSLVATMLPACTSGNAGNNKGFMEQFFPPSPSEVARDAFNVYDPDLRRRSINLLSNAPWGGEEPYLKTYRTMLSPPPDDDPTVRAAALRALGRHGGSEDVRLIVRYLNPKEPDYVRVEAAVALQRLHNQDATEPLMAAVRDDKSPEVRASAANALGHYPDPRVFQVLVGALNDEDYAVVTQAVDTLQLLTGKQFGEDGAAWLAWAEKTKDLFADQRVYYYPQFVKPPGTLDKVQFWKSEKTVAPRQPAGVRPASGGEPKPQSSTATPDSSTQALAVPAVVPRERPQGATATFLNEKNAVWDKPDPSVKVGAPLKNGFIKLQSGQATIQFYSGAKIALFGPADFSPHSDTRAFLRHGKLIAAVPPTQEGFSIGGPTLTVLNRTGGRFGLLINGDGSFDVYAFDSDLDVSYITADTGILKLVPVAAGRLAQIRPSGAVHLADADEATFDAAKPTPPTAALAKRPLGTPDALRIRVSSQLPANRQSPPAQDANAKPHPLGASDAP